MTVNTCPAPHLQRSAKRLTMAANRQQTMTTASEANRPQTMTAASEANRQQTMTTASEANRQQTMTTASEANRQQTMIITASAQTMYNHTGSILPKCPVAYAQVFFKCT